MQYAQIIADHKAGYEPFTYQIPTPLLAHLAKGSVVLVPVGRETVHGVVVDFIRRVDDTLAPKLKPIESVVYPGAFIPGYLIDAVYELKQKYGYGLSATLFCFLPEFPKRKQSEIISSGKPGRGYKVHESIIDLPRRADVYRNLAKRVAQSGQSLLIITSSHNATEALCDKLKVPFTLFPADPSAKSRREYFLHALSAEPTIFIGTRGAIATPLNRIGAVVIDEPWLPGHKEDSSPKMWSALAMQAVCKMRGIPLYLISSVAWPESQLLHARQSVIQTSTPGELTIVPKRPLTEIVTQFLADHDDAHATLAVFVHETHRPVYWCATCERAWPESGTCQKCRKETIMLPPITCDTLHKLLIPHVPDAHITVLPAEALAQYRTFTAALVINFDVYLSITDFRAPSYLRTLITLLRAQAKHVQLVTAHPDTWTPLTQPFDFDAQLVERQTHNLPPFSWAVTLSGKQKPTLEKLDLNEAPDILKASKIHKRRDEYCISLLVKTTGHLPNAWHKKSGLKIDYLPNYVE
ncbi:MAG TPA: hypothetical protein VGE59_02665 [Patescibacteria group bacterium]